MFCFLQSQLAVVHGDIMFLHLGAMFQGSDRAAAKDMFRNLQRMIWRSGNCVDGGSVANLSLRSSVGRNDICLLAERLIILCTKLGICEKDVQRYVEVFLF